MNKIVRWTVLIVVWVCLSRLLFYQKWPMLHQQDTIETDTKNFITYRVGVEQRESIQFLWHGDDNKPLQTFDQLDKYLTRQWKELLFAMNWWIFTVDESIWDKWISYRPEWLYVEDGEQKIPINTDLWEGNFYVQPNGVFSLGKEWVLIMETKQYSLFIDMIDVDYALQSWPLLVHNGAITPLLNSQSTHTYIRNGVCILNDGSILFALSRQTITLYQFAQYFLSQGCTDALYLDGSLSGVYYPQRGRNDSMYQYVTMIAIVVDK